MIFNGNQNISRLAVYSFYDKDGIVDDYVPFFLKDIKRNASEVILVSNGKLTEESKLKLKGTADVILERENKGFDFWGYKTGIEYYGWEKISEYDELIICNSTVYGPLYPFEEMFGEMNKRDLDFWGITQYHNNENDAPDIKFGYLPNHIQSYFMVFRKSIFLNNEFKEYWKTLQPIKSYEEAVGENEAVLTKKFEDLGYKWDVYVYDRELKDHTSSAIFYYPLELIKNKKCPVIKVKTFSRCYNNNVDSARGMSMLGVTDYIKKHTNYNVDLIFDNILRTGNIGNIKNQLHLNYILPKYYQTSNPNQEKAALFMHIYFEDQIDKLLRYSQNIPEWFDIIITTDTEEKKYMIEQSFSKINCSKLSVVLVKNRGRDVSALLVGLNQHVFDYNLICFIHDKKSSQIKLLSVGEYFADNCYENLLCSTEYANNIVALFQEDKRLGVLVPPYPNQGDFTTLPGREWTCNFENTVKLAAEIGINVDINSQIPPIAPLGSMFWFRPEALKKLFEKEWKYEDFEEEPMSVDGTISHAIERIYCFAAQSELFYSGCIVNDEYAKAELTVINCLLQQRGISERLPPVKRISRSFFAKLFPRESKRRDTFIKYYFKIKRIFRISR